MPCVKEKKIICVTTYMDTKSLKIVSKYMQPINMIMIYYWDNKLKRKNPCPGSWYNNIKKNIGLISLAQRMHFLQNVFQMTAIALVSVINHYHINELHLFWDTLYAYAMFDQKILRLQLSILAL